MPIRLGVKTMEKYLDEIALLCSQMSEKQMRSLPLCAAENVISPFAKIPLDSFLQEKYIMGGVLEYSNVNNFLEGKDLFEFYKILNRQCHNLFGSLYADARTLSGVNAVMVLLMSLFKAGDTIYITPEDCGGHTSMPLICRRLGINTVELPYDYEKMDYDYITANRYMENNRVAGILICPSDILSQPSLGLFQLPSECILIYDATQTLGLIASGVNKNPMSIFSNTDNFILMGATHKTLPGPTCGLIMTKNEILAETFDKKINPDYLRNVQFHQILCLILVLTEISEFGADYGAQIIKNANHLAKELESRNFKIVTGSAMNEFTDSHQIFISLDENLIESFVDRCFQYGITLNARYRKIYKDAGIRIGTQEITRYGWKEYEMVKIADILFALKNGDFSPQEISNQINLLSHQKNVCYSFPSDDFMKIRNSLHNS